MRKDRKKLHVHLVSIDPSAGLCYNQRRDLLSYEAPITANLYISESGGNGDTRESLLAVTCHTTSRQICKRVIPCVRKLLKCTAEKEKPVEGENIKLNSTLNTKPLDFFCFTCFTLRPKKSVSYNRRYY